MLKPNSILGSTEEGKHNTITDEHVWVKSHKQNTRMTINVEFWKT